MNITVKELPETEVAFLRRTGSYFEPQEHWGRLLDWALQNRLYPPQQSFIGISLDNPELVEPSECRHDACVTIPAGFEKENHEDIQFKKLEGGLHAVYHFYDTPDKLQEAYQLMYEEWLPNSEYEPDFARHNLEFNLNNPDEDHTGKGKVDLYVPVKKR
ncbi:AraC family transcriptional regulator [Bacillus sp. B-jedd]|uniref:AraC family transcriptional regulator n=1 Tax=Bacillus sp. B-jedd TaxID=1476857 RepID=UPI0005156CFE|nr:GyrI-like domain-containing protein [Bacillus sp. B-jedd]CEG26192.1 putative AraC family transcriptional regulator [Bacillus sp. B-jedd]